MSIPVKWEEFLQWFRATTEQWWSAHEPIDLLNRGIAGVTWQRGTHWLPGLTSEQISAVENKWSLRFPQDYRTFLNLLNAPDRPLIETHYDSDSHLIQTLEPSFYNWLSDNDALTQALHLPLAEIVDTVRQNEAWLPKWGDKPSSASERVQLVHEHAQTASRLIPVIRHRYLVGEPLDRQNPVLSIEGFDIIVYGGDLRTFLLREFSRMLGIERDTWRHQGVETPSWKIPFWGDFLSE